MHYESKSQISIQNGHHQHAHKVFVATHQLNYAIHQLENLQLLSEETAFNFQYQEVSSCNTLFHGQNWSLQQDSTPAHKAQATQQWQEKMFRTSPPLQIGLQHARTYTPWTINCAPIFRRWLASRDTPILKVQSDLFGRELQIFQLICYVNRFGSV